MDSISLDPLALDQLHGEQKALLDAIDDLRKHGIGRFVDLPQIIVVGDQSSGKSSVLEAISRVRFPVKDGLCTRFATELVLRTDKHTKVDVRVQPSPNSTHEGHSFGERSFNKDDLPRIIEDAKKVMLKSDASFSEDILRIEISSPDVPHLTMVDLPGFYHSEDENQSAAGREIVDRLVERYMEKKNSIILAIISARNQVILQKVLSKVKHHDKHKERTLGIITKPDLLTPGSQDEASFIRLAKNIDKSHELSLGWHVLRNRGEADALDNDEQRDETEQKFFNSSVWSSVPSTNRGVASLRKKLSGILLTHIRSNLQGLVESIEENINDRKTRLNRLGEPRSTPRELRTHLDRIASQFHILCLQAVEGNYANDFFGGLYPGDEANATSDSRIRKIRALVRDLNRTFAYILETKGTRRIIVPRDSDVSQQEHPALYDDKCANPISSLPRFLVPLTSQYDFKNPEEVPFNDIASELESLSSANQGNEFPGTSNDLLAVKLFQDQSRPWEEIARRHIQVVLDTTKAFVEKLIGHIVNPDKRTFSAILTEIVDPFFDEKSTILESKLQELLFHYKSGYPQPLDNEFRMLLGQRSQKKLRNHMIQDLMSREPELFTETARVLIRTTPSKSPSEFGVEGLIDKSETYYEMSLRTFTDNVIVLAIENCLIRELPSIFTTDKVNEMEDDELERLASDSPEIQAERDELQAEHDALKKGLQICNKFKERKTMSFLAEPDSVSMDRASGDKGAKSNSQTTPSVLTPSVTREENKKQNPMLNAISQENKGSLFSSPTNMAHGSSSNTATPDKSGSDGLFKPSPSPSNLFGASSFGSSSFNPTGSILPIVETPPHSSRSKSSASPPTFSFSTSVPQSESPKLFSFTTETRKKSSSKLSKSKSKSPLFQET
ncbi:P-loop containing nucleoside triphosphate hydrolase protein [Hypomontagnella monticulosa]|nr:P-loop containing nucleoside triphosphate hydrolase protein [Hypomontagnella monticulosa]